MSELKRYRHRVQVEKAGDHLYSFATHFEGKTADDSRRKLQRKLRKTPLFKGAKYTVGPGRLMS